jgi:hypothetical protein
MTVRPLVCVASVVASIAGTAVGRAQSPASAKGGAKGKAKPGSPVCFIMPEPIASQDPNVPFKDIMGSGPYRFNAAERVAGSLLVYDRNRDYVPRSGGAIEWTGGCAGLAGIAPGFCRPDPCGRRQWLLRRGGRRS